MDNVAGKVCHVVHSDKIMPLTKIFVSIASYRDRECPATITDLFAKAVYPERVFAGVLSQIVPALDRDCLGGEAPHGHVHELRVHAAESQGVCWARHRILRELRSDEPYVLQIDSHMRFEPGWDERFIEMLQRCPADKPVLSSYPVAYVPPNMLGRKHIPVLLARKFVFQSVLRLGSRSIPYEQRPSSPVPSAFVAAGCLFAPARAFDEVPYDPWLYFTGEEMTLAARLWTAGWDLFNPNDVLLYHDYSTDRQRPRHWSDHRDGQFFSARGQRRASWLVTGGGGEDPDALRDIDLYGLGCERSLQAYERFSDIDFKARILGPRAIEGRFEV